MNLPSHPLVQDYHVDIRTDYDDYPTVFITVTTEEWPELAVREAIRSLVTAEVQKSHPDHYVHVRYRT